MAVWQTARDKSRHALIAIVAERDVLLEVGCFLRHCLLHSARVLHRCSRLTWCRVVVCACGCVCVCVWQDLQAARAKGDVTPNTSPVSTAPTANNASPRVQGTGNATPGGSEGNGDGDDTVDPVLAAFPSLARLARGGKPSPPQRSQPRPAGSQQSPAAANGGSKAAAAEGQPWWLRATGGHDGSPHPATVAGSDSDDPEPGDDSVFDVPASLLEPLKPVDGSVRLSRSPAAVVPVPAVAALRTHDLEHGGGSQAFPLSPAHSPAHGGERATPTSPAGVAARSPLATRLAARSRSVSPNHRTPSPRGGASRDGGGSGSSIQRPAWHDSRRTKGTFGSPGKARLRLKGLQSRRRSLALAADEAGDGNNSDGNSGGGGGGGEGGNDGGEGLMSKPSALDILLQRRGAAPLKAAEQTPRARAKARATMQGAARMVGHILGFAPGGRREQYRQRLAAGRGVGGDGGGGDGGTPSRPHVDRGRAAEVLRQRGVGRAQVETQPGGVSRSPTSSGGNSEASLLDGPVLDAILDERVAADGVSPSPPSRAATQGEATPASVPTATGSGDETGDGDDGSGVDEVTNVDSAAASPPTTMADQNGVADTEPTTTSLPSPPGTKFWRLMSVRRVDKAKDTAHAAPTARPQRVAPSTAPPTKPGSSATSGTPRSTRSVAELLRQRPPPRARDSPRVEALLKRRPPPAPSPSHHGGSPLVDHASRVDELLRRHALADSRSGGGEDAAPPRSEGSHSPRHVTAPDAGAAGPQELPPDHDATGSLVDELLRQASADARARRVDELLRQHTPSPPLAQTSSRVDPSARVEQLLRQRPSPTSRARRRAESTPPRPRASASPRSSSDASAGRSPVPLTVVTTSPRAASTGRSLSRSRAGRSPSSQRSGSTTPRRGWNIAAPLSPSKSAMPRGRPLKTGANRAWLSSPTAVESNESLAPPSPRQVRRYGPQNTAARAKVRRR